MAWWTSFSMRVTCFVNRRKRRQLHRTSAEAAVPGRGFDFLAVFSCRRRDDLVLAPGRILVPGVGTGRLIFARVCDRVFRAGASTGTRAAAWRRFFLLSTLRSTGWLLLVGGAVNDAGVTLGTCWDIERVNGRGPCTGTLGTGNGSVATSLWKPSGSAVKVALVDATMELS